MWERLLSFFVGHTENGGPSIPKGVNPKTRSDSPFWFLVVTCLGRREGESGRVGTSF